RRRSRARRTIDRQGHAGAAPCRPGPTTPANGRMRFMDERKAWLSGLSHFIHRHFLGLLIGSYAAAALWPAPGLQLRRLSLGEVALLGERVQLTLSLALLAFLLFSAGLGVQTARLAGLFHGPRVLCAGLAANLLI